MTNIRSWILRHQILLLAMDYVPYLDSTATPAERLAGFLATSILLRAQ